MADVTPDPEGSEASTPRGRRDRAQLFLVAAIVLAVLFVTLAGLLNSVIYSGTLATRDAGADADVTIEYHGAAADVGAALLASANDHDGTADHATLSATVENGLAAWENASTQHAARRGHVTTVENVTPTDGSRISDETAGTDDHFHPAGNVSRHDWTLAESIRVRNYTIEGDPSAAIDPAGDPANVTDSFFVTFGDAHALHLYEDGSESCLVGREIDGDGTIDDDDLSDPVCVASGTIVVDVTDGTVAPGDAPDTTTAFDASFFAALGPGHSIAYRNGDAVEGSYRLVVNEPAGSIDSTPSDAYDDPTDPADGDPTVEAVVYDVSYDVRYRSEDVRYEAPIRIAPEEAAYDDA
ncbi:DUF7261 family protein [Halopenitus persicus]|uniref:DUF7261 family protein n=1 Tax=Halopenitus persicus TaxID=1048396 RepID=UPI000BBB45F2|nr:hypothetical protein [Halopenitus persicus]